MEKAIFTHDGGGREALRAAGGRRLRMTYAQLQQCIAAIRRELQLQPGKVWAMMLPNGIEFVCTFLALVTGSCAAAPLNPSYKRQEIEFNTADSQCAAIILPWGTAGSGQHPALGIMTLDVWEVEIDDVKLIPRVRCIRRSHGSPQITLVDPALSGSALILHTSGTTSRPKCVPLTQANILRTMENVCKTYNLQSADRTLVVMPLFHVHGLIGALLSTLGSGGSAVIPSRFSASEFWKTFLEEDCTWFSAVPTIHQMLLRYPPPKSCGRLRFIRSCSAALAPATYRLMEERYKVPVLEAYAMSEAAHQMTSNPLPPAKRKAGSVGIGQGVAIAVLDAQGNQLLQSRSIGEICVRGKNVTSGYINRPEANREAFTRDGWFRTGDQGYVDEDGYIFLTGRLKELINRGGEKISPLEIDSILLEHPDVLEAVSFGQPDGIYGEQVHAAVVPKPQASDRLKESDLIEFCRARLAKFKCPQRIHIAEQLPRTATGKIQRRIVAEHFRSNNTVSKL